MRGYTCIGLWVLFTGIKCSFFNPLDVERIMEMTNGNLRDLNPGDRKLFQIGLKF